MTDPADEHRVVLARELEELRRQRADLLAACEAAYAFFGANNFNWLGRHSSRGQILLGTLRDAISAATGRGAEDVQDDYCNRYLTQTGGGNEKA